MNTKMKWRLLAMPIALAAIGLPAASCNQLAGANPLDALCCKDFTAGADLSGVDWKIEGAAGVSFGAFMQASADFTGAASAMVNDVAGACQQLAVDLGADEKAVKETAPDARAKAWCALAVAQIKTEVTAKGKLSLTVQPPVCTVSVSAQASCEAKCTADVSCEAELGNIEARCSPGELSGKCDADCTAKCEGSANLAVSCDGTCAGSCEGMCDAAASTGECKGKCSGKCRGSCAMTGGAKVTCEGQCTGGCSVKVRAPKCTGKVTPPSAKCQGDAQCSGSCDASASAKAECKDPSIEITASGTIDAKTIASLKLNLPKIFAVAQARGKLLVDNATAVVNFGADIKIDSLNATAAACLVPAVTGIGQALSNCTASLEASGSIVTSLN